MLNVASARLTVPLLLKARLVMATSPCALTVPALVKWSGAVQQLVALIVVKFPMVRVPRLSRVVVPPRSPSAGSFRAVVPWRVRAVGAVVGEVRTLVAAPLIVVA